MATDDRPAQRIRFYAPQDGVVYALNAADGMYLRPDTRAMSLADTGSVWLMVDVFERDMGLVTPNMRAEARFDHLPGQLFRGEIDYIFPELDAETRTLRVRLRFDNDKGLLGPNMFAKVALVPGETRQALTVPSEAVIRTGRAERVILRLTDGSFRPRLVTTGLRGGFTDGRRTEIVQGLAPGDEVVASAQFLIDSESALNAGMMRFAPTEADPATGKGVLLSLDTGTRRARIAHAPIEALGWPAMESEFALRSDIYLADLTVGQDVEFEAVRGADGLIALTRLGRDDGVDATGEGVVHAVTPEGKLTVSHDPIPALGWPAMKMDLDVQGVDTAAISLGEPVSFDLSAGEDGMAMIVAIRSGGAEAEAAPEMTEAEPQEDAAPPITVEGRIEAVDAETGMATIAHGPIAEIGMPGMTMDFALTDALDPTELPMEQDVILTFVRPDGLTMVLDAVESKAEPMSVTGTINSVDAEAGMVNITHGPIAAIGMPGMTMDFALAGDVDPADLPVGQETGLLLMQDADMSLSLVGTSEPGQ